MLMRGVVISCPDGALYMHTKKLSVNICRESVLFISIMCKLTDFC